MSSIKNNWTLPEVLNLFEKSFNELLFEAHETHIKNHNKDTVQVCTLLSVKTPSKSKKSALISILK